MFREGSGNVEDVAWGMDETAVRQPLGVFTAITPFNFPAVIPLSFLPYPVTTGNTFILKPSEKVPLSSQVIFEAIDAVEFLVGVINLVNSSADTVNTLQTHDDVAGVSFVGSSLFARHIYETAAENGKRVQAQDGTKNYAGVTESAEPNDLIPTLSDRSTLIQANVVLQTMSSLESVILTMTSGILDAVNELTVGDELDEDTDIGPPNHR